MFIFFFSPLSPAQGALSCKDLFSTSAPSSPILTPQLYSLLEPLQIVRLVQKIDFQSQFDPSTTFPSYDKVVYSREDAVVLKELGLPTEKMKNEHRWVQTDYGFALMDVHSLRDWSLLSRVIKDPEAAKKFIEYVAENEGVYPAGIARESADWLRWSILAIESSLDFAARNTELDESAKKKPRQSRG